MLDVANVVCAHVSVREKEQENKNIIIKKERIGSLARARILQSLHLRKRQSTPSTANNSIVTLCRFNRWRVRLLIAAFAGSPQLNNHNLRLLPCNRWYDY